MVTTLQAQFCKGRQAELYVKVFCPPSHTENKPKQPAPAEACVEDQEQRSK